MDGKKPIHTPPSPLKKIILRHKTPLEIIVANIHRVDPLMNHYTLHLITKRSNNDNDYDTVRYTAENRACLIRAIGNIVQENLSSKKTSYGVFITFAPIVDVSAKEQPALFPGAPRVPSIAYCSFFGDTLFLAASEVAKKIFASNIIPQDDIAFNSPTPTSADKLLPYLESPSWALDRQIPGEVQIPEPDEFSNFWMGKILGDGVCFPLNKEKRFLRPEYNAVLKDIFEQYHRWHSASDETIAYLDSNDCIRLSRDTSYMTERFKTLRDWMNYARLFDPIHQIDAVAINSVSRRYPSPRVAQENERRFEAKEAAEEAKKKLVCYDEDPDLVDRLEYLRKREERKNMHYPNFAHRIVASAYSIMAEYFMSNPPEKVPIWMLAMATDDIILKQGLLKAVLQQAGSFESESVLDIYRDKGWGVF